MYDLTDRSVLVTGSTKGIGRAIAERFVAEGARVLVNGRDADEVATVRDRIGASVGLPGDVGTAEGVEALLAALEEHGPVDVLINNAALYQPGDFFELDDEVWQRHLDVNVMGVVRLSRALLPGMLERGHGHIVNVSSEAGVKPVPTMLPYSVTKSAVNGLSRGLAELTKGTEVTVNSLLPGPTWTEGTSELFDGMAEAEGVAKDELLEGHVQEHEPTSLIQRFATVEEVADGACFLVTNSAVNGSALRVEGGLIRSV